MSKSRGNVINPDNVVKTYGADALRLYEMFMGPLEKVKPWQETGIKGVFNFLNKAYKFFADGNNLKVHGEEDEEVAKLLHKTIKKVSEDIEKMHFNTAISQLMVLTNLCVKKQQISKQTAEVFALLLSPFAPHVGEALWKEYGHQKSLCNERWPSFDPQLATDELVTIAVSVNGKTRATLQVPKDISQEDFIALAKEQEKVKKYLTGVSILKEVYVPGKICNFVVK